MKKIHIIAKTHLDLGFTDYAAEIEKLYIEKFFPAAIKLAKELNTDKKRFIWTTGSWIIENALKKACPEIKKQLEEALERGDIAPHALPFTTHTELLDKDTFEYGLEIAAKLKKKYGLNLCAAKMTDVPGHTKAIIPLLKKYGIKLLHIGVNDSSAAPKLPQAFVWKHNEDEIIVLYEDSYGGLYKNEHIDDILFFAHSMDNHGPNAKDSLLRIYAELEKRYPDYTVEASTLDEYASALWRVKDKLPVITSEIGDSWIHGAASDPYKSAAIKELISLKNKWLSSGELKRNTNAYENLTNHILMLAEHTWGMDVKKHLSDIGIYLKKDFNAARQKDIVKLNYKSLRGWGWKIKTDLLRKKGVYNKGSYSAIEKSWAEQREYIDKALEKLDDKLKAQALAALKKLRPQKGFGTNGFEDVENRTIKFNDITVEFNKYGAIKNFTAGDKAVISGNHNSLIDYRSYGSKDYDFWLSNYSRNVKEHKIWVIPDFARPLLHLFDKKYPQGRFAYFLNRLTVKEEGDFVRAHIQLDIDSEFSDALGAPRKLETLYTFYKNKIGYKQKIIWMDKDASRLPEALFIHFNHNIDQGSLRYKKMGETINPYDIVVNGNRNLSAVEEINFDIGGEKFILKNFHSPLAAMGKGKILKFDNKYPDIAEGLSFVLYNNVWGTNFPLWYSENAYFAFELIPVQ
ncbi:MAG: DUF5054 domain-containing protein [Christensenellales bacterium]|jgi:hypothetical protein|nr:DUF5054 domain-containing protein [Clostridiales bacterium]